MRSSSALSVFVCSLLLVLSAAQFIPGEFNLVLNNGCTAICRQALLRSLGAGGNAGCSIQGIVPIRTKSFVSIKCRPQRQGQATLSFAAADSAAASVFAALSRTRNAAVETVEANSRFRFTQAGASFGIDEIDGEDNNRRCTRASQLGRGIDVYILDSGCRPTAGGLCTSDVTGDPGCRDRVGHGTAVGSIAVSGRFGFAARARRHCLKIGNASGISNFDVIRAIGRVVRNNRPAAKRGVVNISISGPRSNTLNMAINMASTRRLFFVVSAGNDNMNSCRASPATATLRDPFTFSIAAHNRNGRPARFTNFGRCADLSAAGVRIRAQGGTFDGTSFSAPHVAGAIAVLLSDRKAVNVRALTGTRVIPRIRKRALEIDC